MATSASPRGKTVTFLTKDQSGFDTAASGDYWQTFLYSHGLEDRRPLENDPLIGLDRTNDRDATAPAPGLPDASGPIEIPWDLNHVGIWLQRLFGAPSTSGSGDDYVHVFTSGNEVLPHFTCEAKVKSGLYFQYVGCLANTLNLTMQRASGYQRASIGISFRHEAKLTSSGGGTPTVLERSPLANTLATFKKDGAVLGSVLALQNVAYDNKAVGQNYLGSDRISGHDLDDEAMFGGSLRMRFKDATLYDLAAAGPPGTAFAGELLWQVSSTRLLSIAAPAMRLEKRGVSIQGPGGIEQEFAFRCEQTDSDAMLTVTLKNSVASYA